jgi:hypothetical protein
MKFQPEFKSTFLLFAAYLLIASISDKAYAQNSNRNSLDINFGISNFHIVDDLATELVFRGNGIAASLRFTQVRNMSLHGGEASYFHSMLTTQAENFSTENFKGRFHYGYYFKTIAGPVFNKQVELYLGGSFTSLFCSSDYYFDKASIQARATASWYWSHSLDVGALLDFHLSERNLVRFQVYMPFISNVSRPVYSSMGDFDIEKNDYVIKPFGKTSFFSDNLSVTNHLLYRYCFEKFYMQAGWEFCYIKYKDPSVIKMYMNNFRLGAGFNF